MAHGIAIPNDWARGDIDVQVGRDPATHAQDVAIEKWETLVRRLRGVNNIGQEGRGVGIDGESLDLKRELDEEMNDGKAEIKESKSRKGNPVPLQIIDQIILRPTSAVCAPEDLMDRKGE